MVTHDFYMNEYRGGSISAKDWPTFEARAADQLARYKRIYTVTAPDSASHDPESMAICAMADALAYFTAALNGTGGPVSSASIGSVSTSYAGASSSAVDLSAKGQSKELYRCASMYLDIYRGVGGC